MTRFLKLPMTLDGDVYIPTDTDEFEGKITKELAIDPDNLDADLIESPQKQWFWYSAAGHLKAMHEAAVDEVKRVKAELYCKYKTVESAAGRYPGDVLVENMVEKHADVQDALANKNRMSHLFTIADAAKWAFKDRHQVLLALVQRHRAESMIDESPTSVTGGEQRRRPSNGSGPPRLKGRNGREDPKALESFLNSTQG